MRIFPNKPMIADGFTLVEMVLAIGVAAIVLITITSVLFAALRMRDATQALVDSETPIDQAMSTMRLDLEGLMTPTNGTIKILSGGFRVGNLTSLGIATPVAVEMYTTTGELTQDKPWGDIQRVTYELRAPQNHDAAGKDLIRTVSRNLLTTSTPDTEDEWMMGDVQTLTFSCYDGTQWWNTWDTTGITSANTNLPTAVRVDIQFAGNKNLAPVEIVVSVDSVTRTNITPTAASTTGGGGGGGGGGG